MFYLFYEKIIPQTCRITLKSHWRNKKHPLQRQTTQLPLHRVGTQSYKNKRTPKQHP